MRREPPAEIGANSPGSCCWRRSSARVGRARPPAPGAALESIGALSSLERMVLAEPCSPDIANG